MTDWTTARDDCETQDKPATDWKELQEECKYREMPVFDETGPQRILDVLSTLQLKGVEKEGLVFLKHDAITASRQIAFISASELFTWGIEHDAWLKRRRASRTAGAVDLFMAKAFMLCQANNAFKGMSAQLYVLDLDKGLVDPANQPVAYMLEHDMRTVRKFVCAPEELLERLHNPFGAAYNGDLVPQLEISRVDHLSFEPEPRDFASTVTHAFVPGRAPSVWHQKLQRHPESVRLNLLANRLAKRIMGRDYELHASEDVVVLLRGGQRQELPWFCLGNGEQYGLAFCSFLALASEDASSASWIGFSDVLTYLDDSRYLLFLEVLHDFILATGANIYLRANKKDCRDVAQRKLAMASEAYKNRPY